jgi:hypothetical protein
MYTGLTLIKFFWLRSYTDDPAKFSCFLAMVLSIEMCGSGQCIRDNNKPPITMHTQQSQDNICESFNLHTHFCFKEVNEAAFRYIVSYAFQIKTASLLATCQATERAGSLCSSGGYLSISYRGGPGSSPVQVMWDLWWTKRHWSGFFP